MSSSQRQGFLCGSQPRSKFHYVMSGCMRQLCHISFAQGPSSVLQLSPNQNTCTFQLASPAFKFRYQPGYLVQYPHRDHTVMEGWNYISADWLGQVLFLTLFPSSLVLISFFLQVIFKSCDWWSFDPGDSEPYATRSSLCGSYLLCNSTVIRQPEAVFCTELVSALNCNCPGFEGQGRNEGRGGGRD